MDLFHHTSGKIQQNNLANESRCKCTIASTHSCIDPPILYRHTCIPSCAARLQHNIPTHTGAAVVDHDPSLQTVWTLDPVVPAQQLAVQVTPSGRSPDPSVSAAWSQDQETPDAKLVPLHPSDHVYTKESF